jgi:hypothetical protein
VEAAFRSILRSNLKGTGLKELSCIDIYSRLFVYFRDEFSNFNHMNFKKMIMNSYNPQNLNWFSIRCSGLFCVAMSDPIFRSFCQW